MLHSKLTCQHESNRSLIAALAISFALFLLVLVEPLGADNAVLHSMALDLVRYGRLPYIGTWDNNFPGIVFLHAIGIRLLGESGISFRIFDILIQLLFVAFLFNFLLRWLKPHTAALAGVMYAAYYVSGGTYLFGQQDGYGMMLVLMGTSLIIPKSQGKDINAAQIAVGGMISGLPLLMRPTFALYIGILGIYVLFQTDKRSIIIRLLRSALFTVAALLPIAALIYFYSSIPGGLEAFYTSTIRFNLDVYTKLAGGTLWIEVFRSGLLIPLAIWAIFLNGGERSELIIKDHQKKEILLLASFIGAGLFIVFFMGKYWRYQFAPFYIAMIPFSAVGIERLMIRAQEGLRRHYVMVISVLLSTFIAYNPIAPMAFALGLIEHSDPFQKADEARRPSPLFGAKPEHDLIAYIERPENRSGAIEICGFDPYLRLNLNRPFVGPYATFHALAFRTDATNLGFPHYTDYQRKWQTDYVALLEKSKPRFIILGRHQSFWYIHDIYDDCLRYIPGFDTMLNLNYRFDTAFGGFQVYRSNRKDK